MLRFFCCLFVLFFKSQNVPNVWFHLLNLAATSVSGGGRCLLKVNKKADSKK